MLLATASDPRHDEMTWRQLFDQYARRTLGGITFGTKRSMAVINGKTLSEGESAAVSVKPGTLTIKCLKIERDSVLITIDGEAAPPPPAPPVAEINPVELAIRPAPHA